MAQDPDDETTSWADDSRLVDESQQEDVRQAIKAFMNLFERYSPSIYAKLRRDLGDRAGYAPDLLDVVAERAWKRLRNGKRFELLPGCGYRAYLSKIATNVVIAFWRRYGNKSEISWTVLEVEFTVSNIPILTWDQLADDESLVRFIVTYMMTTLDQPKTDAADSMSDYLALLTTRLEEFGYLYGEQVVAEIKLLPPRQRDCLILRLLCDYSQQHIAEIMRIEVSTVGWHISQGRARLRAALAALWAEAGYSRWQIADLLNVRDKRNRNGVVTRTWEELIEYYIEQGNKARRRARRKEGDTND